MFLKQCGHDGMQEKYISQISELVGINNRHGRWRHISIFTLHKNVLVAQGYLSNLKARDILYTHILQEDKIVVYITNVQEENRSVDEPFLEMLLEREQTFIRWRIEYIRHKFIVEQ